MLALLLLLPFVEASALKGTVYDFSLEVAEDAIVLIDTQPRQTFVAKDGNYYFTLEPGTYILTAVLVEDQEIIARAEEKVTISNEGDFTLDLILFPSFGDLETLLNETDFVEENSLEDSRKFPYWIVFVVILILLGFFGIKLLKRKKKIIKKEEKKEEDESEKVLAFIKKEGGRTTQKDIRKQSNLSEAKISLIISELESKGIVKKIKKGRGNVIVLEKKE